MAAFGTRAGGGWRRRLAATGCGGGEAVGREEKKTERERERGDDKRVPHPRVIHISKNAFQNCRMVKIERFCYFDCQRYPVWSWMLKIKL
jgi:hypothetical protein